MNAMFLRARNRHPRECGSPPPPLLAQCLVPAVKAIAGLAFKGKSLCARHFMPLPMILLLLGGDLRAAGLMLNSDFTGSLSSWTAAGTVFNTGDTAVFSDSVATPTSIFQTAAAPSAFTGFDLSFDVFNGLSSTVPGGFVPDSFFATLYLGSSPFGATLAGGAFDVAIALFDMDFSGGYNLASGASFGPSPKGSGWTRYSLSRVTAPTFTDPGFLTLAFEFFNLNGVGSDSVAAIDHVTLIPSVPEPGISALLVLTAFTLCLRRRRPSNHCS